MEQIVKIYGRFLLEAAAFAGFWMLVLFGISDVQGHRGFFQMMGNYFTQEQTAYGADFQMCVEESRRATPVISYKKEAALSIGVYPVTELVGATDCEKKQLAVEVQDIYNTQGESDIGILDADSMQLSFETPGIYRLKVRAVDCWNGMSICWICVPVS